MRERADAEGQTWLAAAHVAFGRDVAGEAAEDRGAACGNERRRGARGRAARGGTDSCAPDGASWPRRRRRAPLPVTRSVGAQAFSGALSPLWAQAIPRVRQALQHGAAAGSQDISRPNALAGVSRA